MFCLVAQRLQQDFPTNTNRPVLSGIHRQDPEAGDSCCLTNTGGESEESQHLSPSLSVSPSTAVSRDTASALNLLRSARLLVALLTSFVASLNFTALETVWAHFLNSSSVPYSRLILMYRHCHFL